MEGNSEVHSVILIFDRRGKEDRSKSVAPQPLKHVLLGRLGVIRKAHTLRGRTTLTPLASQ